MIVYGLTVIMLLVVCLVTPSLAGTFCIFLFLLRIFWLPGFLVLFCIYFSGYLITIFVLYSLAIVVKKNRSLPVYFRFFSQHS